MQGVTAGNFSSRSRAVSICNCRACQRRSGSAFGIQAGFKADQVQVSGRFSDYAAADEADRKEHTSTRFATSPLSRICSAVSGRRLKR
jgi:hypothetical protein